MASPSTSWQPPELATDSEWMPPELAASTSWQPPEFTEQETDWQPPELQQSPLETGARAAAMAPGTFATGAVEGIGTAIQDVSDAADMALPGIGTLLPRLIPGAQFLKDAAPIAADISEEAQRVYAPDAQRNPIANTIGSGVGQAVGMLPLALTGGTPLVLGAAAASGYGEGSQTATELGIENPLGRIALGGTYAGVETAVERLGGIGAGPVKAAGREIVESLGKSTLKTIGSETLEEPVTGALQDAATLVAAQPVLDPAQPGQTVTGYRTGPLSPTNPEYWQKRGLEAIGGAAGGTVFAGLGALGRLSQPPTAGQPGTPPPLPPPAPTATVDIDGTPYTYNPAALTPEQITSLRATGSLQDYIDSGILTNATLPPPLPAAAPAPEAGGVADNAPMGPPPLPVAPPPPSGPTVQEAQETLGDLGNVGSTFAGASLAGRPGPPPLARDLNGDLDLLNYLNENPIRAPRKGQEGSASGEYDWRESADFDPAYRRHIMQEGEPNIDQRAQEAFDLGFISAPTADALAAKVNEVIGKRRQQRQDRRSQTRQIDDLEAAALNFDRLQTRLSQTGGRPIDPATLQPGRTLTIEGEPVIVSGIDYDQDGMPARLTLNTPAGQVFLGTESPLFEDATAETDTLSDEELNAQLELAANPDGFTNTTVGTREDGSTIVFAELVALAAQAVQAGTRFAQWAADMVRQFGQGIKRYLAGAWQAARKTSEVGARANLNPNARLTARPPTMAEAMEGQVRDSQFGERVQADPRLTPGVTAAAPTQFAVQGQQQALDAALSLIRDLGLDGATARFTADASLPMPVRIAGLMQAALQYDARAALLHRQRNTSMSASADAATAAAIEAKANLEFIGNETGRNLAMFNAWNRMSPDGQLRRVDRQLEQGALDTIRGDIGTTVEEIDEQVQQATNDLTDDIIEQILLEGAPPQPVNLQTGAPIAERSFLDVFLGGVQQAAQAIADSTTIQSALRAVDTALKALSGKLFADPLLLTPAAQAILKTTRALLLQGTKLSQAIADAVADVRTKINIPPADVPPLTNAVTNAIIKEIVRPVLRKLAFDPSYNKREAVKDMLAMGIGVMPATRLADAVIAARPRIIKTAQDKIRERVMRRLSDRPRSRSRKQKLPAIIDTLVIAAANGFLTEKTFLDAWDKKHPLPKLKPADRQRLLDLAREANLLPEGILRQAKAIEFQNAVALIEGIPTADAITAAWYANILSGLSTQGVNIWGNGLNAFFRTLTAGFASPKEFTALLNGLAQGVVPGMREARQVLKSGQLLKVGKMDDMQKASALELMSAQGQPKGFGQWMAYLISIGGLTRYVFRAMGAMDAVFWHSAQEGHAHLAIARAVRKELGLKPGSPAFNAEFIRQLGGDETQFLADLDQARTELLAAGVTPAQGAVNRRAWEIRTQRRSQRVQDSSVRWADRLVFQQEPEGAGRVPNKIISTLQNWRPYGIPVFLPVVPFNRILSNLFESSLDWAGIGILRGMLGYHLSEHRNPDKRLFDTVERRERFFAGVLGLGIGGTLLAAAMALKDMDDDEVPFMVYGSGPPDPTRRGTMPKGWRPFTMKIRGQYVNYAESPVGPLLAAVGGWLDAERYGKHENKDIVERGTLAFLSAVQGFTKQGVLASLANVVEIWTGESGVKGLKQIALTPVSGFVPAQGLLRDMSTIYDPRKISSADITGALVKDIPVLKSYGMPELNVLGEEVQTAGLPVVRRFMTGQKPDANISFIQKHDLKITALDRSIEIGTYLDQRAKANINREENDRRIALGMTALENGVMTPAQQHQFVKAQGAAIKTGLERLRVDYATAPKDARTTQILQKRIDATVEAARKKAMRDLVTELK